MNKVKKTMVVLLLMLLPVVLFAQKKGNNGKTKTPSNMVLIPAGYFWMGSNDSDSLSQSDEKPKHKVYLDAYSIDKYEVTNAQYKKCVNAGKCNKPHGTAWYNDSKFANHPVVYVDWNMAETFCKWAGKRLPTEAEWEKASRGEQGYVYPWGNTWMKTNATTGITKGL